MRVWMPESLQSYQELTLFLGFHPPDFRIRDLTLKLVCSLFALDLKHALSVTSDVTR